jgi:hypothetical protein
MAKKHKSAEDIIYQIKDLLDDLELKINPEETHHIYAKSAGAIQARLSHH